MKSVLAALLLFVCSAVRAQVSDPQPYDVLDRVEKEALRIASAHLRSNGAEFGLPPGFVPKHESTYCRLPDEETICVVRFERQSHQGIPVEGTEIQVRLIRRKGVLRPEEESCSYGGCYLRLTLSTAPKLDAAAAKAALAKLGLPCESFNPEESRRVKECPARPAELAAQGLVVTKRGGAYALAWRFEVKRRMIPDPEDLDYVFAVYLDAHTGAMISQELISPTF